MPGQKEVRLAVHFHSFESLGERFCHLSVVGYWSRHQFGFHLVRVSRCSNSFRLLNSPNALSAHSRQAVHAFFDQAGTSVVNFTPEYDVVLHIIDNVRSMYTINMHTPVNPIHSL